MSFKSYRRKRLMSSSSSSPGGIGFTGMLTIVFIALKLTGNVTWPWIWVLSPLWIGFLLGLAALAIILLVAYLEAK